MWSLPVPQCMGWLPETHLTAVRCSWVFVHKIPSFNKILKTFTFSYFVPKILLLLSTKQVKKILMETKRFSCVFKHVTLAVTEGTVMRVPT